MEPKTSPSEEMQAHERAERAPVKKIDARPEQPTAIVAQTEQQMRTRLLEEEQMLHVAREAEARSKAEAVEIGEPLAEVITLPKTALLETSAAESEPQPESARIRQIVEILNVPETSEVTIRELSLPAIELPSETGGHFAHSYESELDYAETPTIQAWEQELRKESTVLYEDFTEALTIFVAKIEALQTGEALQESAAPSSRIASVVAEQLSGLNAEAKPEVAETLRELTGTLHGMLMLEARDAELEYIAGAEQRLVELCETLFKQLEIEYTEQDIKNFVTVLRDPDLRPAATADINEAKDLGTHEAKYFARMVNASSRMTQQLRAALGTVVLVSLGMQAAVDDA